MRSPASCSSRTIRRAGPSRVSTTPERTHLANVVVVDAGSRWRGKHGVHIGMSLAELRARNGKAFWFTGFDADGRGSVRDTWDAGSLDVDIGEMYFGVDLRVRGATKGVLGKAVPSGDEPISSDDPRYPKLGELVGSVRVHRVVEPRRRVGGALRLTCSHAGEPSCR